MTDFVVVGAGLVGCFVSLLLAKTQQGERRIFLYEKRKEDAFEDSSSAKTSINLALSARVLKAVQAFPHLYKQITELSMPMYGRMYHFGHGKVKIIPYSINKSNCLLSIERNLLHSLLLGEVQKQQYKIELHFNCHICQINLKERWICVKTEGEEEEKEKFKTFDFLIGADGFNSIVRNECHFEFLEMDSDLFYQEIEMEKLHPNDDDEKNWKSQPFLHIWPVDNQMSVALPNKHKNPTCTLFTQSRGKYHLRTILSLQSNKGGHCALIGDAAHTLLPFYGQGVNAGFEDACVLGEIFAKTGSFTTFTQMRFKDSKRIFLLSMDNFYQMNRGIQSKCSIIAHWICIWLDYLMPQFHFSLYRMISFTCIPYEEAYQRMKKVKFVFCLFLLLISLTLVNKICFG